MYEEAVTLRTALGHLHAERTALESGEVDSLAMIAARKSDAYGRLAQLGDARVALLARAGVKPARNRHRSAVRQRSGMGRMPAAVCRPDRTGARSP
jgi:flagellar biosynthesis/type III secretory pathway chaperone